MQITTNFYLFQVTITYKKKEIYLPSLQECTIFQTKGKKILRYLLILPFTHNKFSCWNIKQPFPDSSANDIKDGTACPTICQGMCLHTWLRSVEVVLDVRAQSQLWRHSQMQPWIYYINPWPQSHIWLSKGSREHPESSLIKYIYLKPVHNKIKSRGKTFHIQSNRF